MNRTEPSKGKGKTLAELPILSTYQNKDPEVLGEDTLNLQRQELQEKPELGNRAVENHVPGERTLNLQMQEQTTEVRNEAAQNHKGETPDGSAKQAELAPSSSRGIIGMHLDTENWTNDHRLVPPSSNEEAQAIQEALLITKVQFVGICGKNPTEEPDCRLCYWWQWVGLQQQMNKNWVRKGFLSHPPMLVGRGPWSGGVLNWASARITSSGLGAESLGDS